MAKRKTKQQLLYSAIRRTKGWITFVMPKDFPSAPKNPSPRTFARLFYELGLDERSNSIEGILETYDSLLSCNGFKSHFDGFTWNDIRKYEWAVKTEEAMTRLRIKNRTRVTFIHAINLTRKEARFSLVPVGETLVLPQTCDEIVKALLWQISYESKQGINSPRWVFEDWVNERIKHWGYEIRYLTISSFRYTK